MRDSWTTRLGAALLIWASGALFSLWCLPASYPAYYFEAALFDAVLIFAYRVLGRNALVHDLQWLALFSIAGQATGFMLYMLYQPPTFYNIFIHTLQAAEWVRILMVRTDDKLPTNNWRFDMVRNRVGSRPKRFAPTENL